MKLHAILTKEQWSVVSSTWSGKAWRIELDKQKGPRLPATDNDQTKNKKAKLKEEDKRVPRQPSTTWGQHTDLAI